MSLITPEEHETIDLEEMRERRAAERIADALFERIYRDIGRSVFKRLMWLAVAVIIVLAVKFHLVEIPTFK